MIIIQSDFDIMKRKHNRVNGTGETKAIHETLVVMYERPPCDKCDKRNECRSKAMACNSFEQYLRVRASKRRGWETASRMPTKYQYK